MLDCHKVVARMLLGKHLTADLTARDYEELFDPKWRRASELRNSPLEKGCPTSKRMVGWCHLQMVEFTAILRDR